VREEQTTKHFQCVYPNRQTNGFPGRWIGHWTPKVNLIAQAAPEFHDSTIFVEQR